MHLIFAIVALVSLVIALPWSMQAPEFPRYAKVRSELLGQSAIIRRDSSLAGWQGWQSQPSSDSGQDPAPLWPHQGTQTLIAAVGVVAAVPYVVRHRQDS